MTNRENYTSNLKNSIYLKINTIIGSSYISTNWGNLDITYIGGYPSSFIGYEDKIPLVIMDYKYALQPQAYDMGGSRKYTDVIHIHIIGGGYDNDSYNDYMTNALADKIRFGFDQKQFSIIDAATGAVDGRFYVNVTPIARLGNDLNSVFEKHHREFMLSTWTPIYNN